MNVATILLALVAYASAVPAPKSEEIALSTFDWGKITPLNVLVEPISTALVVPGTRIINGFVPANNSIPWQGYIIINGLGFCGCSVISTTWFLSAAHCTHNAVQVQIVLGAHNRLASEATQRIVYATGVVNHAGYNTSVIANDISLLRIATPITFTNAIRAVPLAAANATDYAGRIAILSGWGLTQNLSQPAELHRVDVQVITNAACQLSYGSFILPSHICTSGRANNNVVGGCQSDSGGPLTVDGVQVGVVSFTSISCLTGHPTGYTRVSSFRSWVQQNSGV